jgi:iron complex transport system substrate-binding protein
VKKWFWITLISLPAALSFLAGCQGTSTEGSSAQEFNIDSVPSISLENKKLDNQLRIVAVGNGSAEILLSLGLTNQIVGRDITSEIPALKEVPIVTNGHDLDAEKILATKPDILFIDSNSSPKSVINQVRRIGVQVVEVDEAYSIEGISEKIEQIATALASPNRGAALIEKISNQFQLFAENNEKKSAIFLYLRGSNGIFLVGGPGSGADSIIQAAGAVDLGVARYKNPFNPINSEAVAGLKPDYYLLMSAGLKSVGGLEKFRALPGINPAIPVITVNDSLLLSFGPRTPALVQELHRIFYG